MWQKWFRLLLILIVINVGCAGVAFKSVTAIKSAQLNDEKKLMNENLATIESRLELEVNQMLSKVLDLSNMSDLSDLLSISKENMLNGAGDRVNALKNKYNSMLTDIASDMDDVVNLSILNKDGLVYSSIYPEMVGSNEAKERFFKNAMTSGEEISLTNQYWDEESSYVTVVSRTIQEDDNKLGIIAIMLNDSFYDKVMEESEVLDGSYYLVNEKNRIVYSDKKEKIGKRFKQKKEKLTYEKATNDEKWKLIATQDINSVMEATKRPIERIYLLLGVVMTASILCLIYYYFKLKKDCCTK